MSSVPLPAECGECVKERPKKASRGAVPPHHWQLHLSVPRIGHATCGEKLTARVRVEALREGKERKVGCTIARSKRESLSLREGPGWARGYGASSLNSIAGSHGHEPWLGIQKSRESCQGAPVLERVPVPVGVLSTTYRGGRSLGAWTRRRRCQWGCSGGGPSGTGYGSERLEAGGRREPRGGVLELLSAPSIICVCVPCGPSNSTACHYIPTARWGRPCCPSRVVRTLGSDGSDLLMVSRARRVAVLWGAVWTVEEVQTVTSSYVGAPRHTQTQRDIGARGR